MIEPLEESTQVITTDIGQNVCLPHSGSDQVSKMYHLFDYDRFSVRIFGQWQGFHGCVCVGWSARGESQQQTVLSHVSTGTFSFVYSSITFSCRFVFKFLMVSFLIPITDPWLDNTPICNWTSNCAGQNKKQIMIKFLIWLCEVGLWKQQHSFFIKDHVKNIEHLWLAIQWLKPLITRKTSTRGETGCYHFNKWLWFLQIDWRNFITDKKRCMWCLLIESPSTISSFLRNLKNHQQFINTRCVVNG